MRFEGHYLIVLFLIFYFSIRFRILALLLLYDVTNKTTYDNIRAWLGEIREYAQEDVVIVLIGEIELKGFQIDLIKGSSAHSCWPFN